MLEKHPDIEGYARIALPELTLMNDQFMNWCFNGNIPCVKAILSKILGRDDFGITSVETQKELRGVRYIEGLN